MAALEASLAAVKTGDADGSTAEKKKPAKKSPSRAKTGAKS
jgi:hypothetical protein